MRTWLLALTPLLVVLAVALGPALGPASAQSLDALRAGGAVGERFDGLAVVRDPGASAQVQSLVNEVNQKRQQIYGQRASQQGVPVDQVGRVYAAEILRNAPAGTWFLGENGQWAQK
jgi:uncharacterized protein YdbL (DUF1318 family)